MSDGRPLYIYDPENPGRDNVLALLCHDVEAAGKTVHILVRPPVKSREQEQHYHAMIGDIAKQVPFYGKMRDADTFWKRLLIDAFKHDTKAIPELAEEWAKFGSVESVPALNHDGFVIIGEQSRKFTKKLASAFIDWLGAYGGENGVIWTPPKKWGGE